MDHKLSKDKLKQCEDIISYQFNDRDLCWEALNVAGSGVTQSGERTFPNGNKRLAVLGDSVLATVLCEPWYRNNRNEGLLSIYLATLWVGRNIQ